MACCCSVSRYLSGGSGFFALLGRIELWPLIPPIDVKLPDDHRAWRMVHMESISQGLMLMALGLGGRFVQLSTRQHRLLFWSALITAWLFTVPTWFHALFGTRGLAFGGDPFKPGLANDVLYLTRRRGRRQMFVMRATQRRFDAHPEALADPMALLPAHPQLPGCRGDAGAARHRSQL
jgi:hypothetical protein